MLLKVFPLDEVNNYSIKPCIQISTIELITYNNLTLLLLLLFFLLHYGMRQNNIVKISNVAIL